MSLPEEWNIMQPNASPYQYGSTSGAPPSSEMDWGLGAYPSPGASTSTGNDGSLGGTGLDWVKFAAMLAQSQHKGKFTQVPQSPQERAIYDYAMQRVKALPNTTADLYPLALSKAYTSAPPFDINKAKAGQTAYNPADAKVDPAIMARLFSSGSTQPGPLGGEPGSSTQPPTNYDVNGNPQENRMPNLAGAHLGGAGHQPLTQEGGPPDDSIYSAMTNQGTSGYGVNAALGETNWQSPTPLGQQTAGLAPAQAADYAKLDAQMTAAYRAGVVSSPAPPSNSPEFLTWIRQEVAAHPQIAGFLGRAFQTIGGMGAGALTGGNPLAGAGASAAIGAGWNRLTKPPGGKP